MCAENTPVEAILQGIGEIFERYCCREIYMKRLTPPTIPHNEFKGTRAYEMIKYLSTAKDYDVIIKDYFYWNRISGYRNINN